MCKSQRESSVPRQCRRARRHFNTPSAREAASQTKRNSAQLSLRLAPTDKLLTYAISHELSSRRGITRSTAGWVENRRLRLQFSNSRARTRSPPQMQCARKWLSSNNVFLADWTTQSFTIRRSLSANQFTKFKRRSSKQSGSSC